MPRSSAVGGQGGWDTRGAAGAGPSPVPLGVVLKKDLRFSTSPLTTSPHPTQHSALSSLDTPLCLQKACNGVLPEREAPGTEPEGICPSFRSSLGQTSLLTLISVTFRKQTSAQGKYYQGFVAKNEHSSRA